VKSHGTGGWIRRIGWRGAVALAGALSVMSVVLFVPGRQPGAQADAVAGQQGTDTSLPLTSSHVTVSGRGTFSGLSVTVNQTQNLENQDISVTWTGGAPTDGPNGFLDNYLQIFQCWGAPDPSDPLDSVNPGPPPTQCEVGGWNINTSSYPVGNPTFAYTRNLASPAWSDYSQLQTAVPGSTEWTDQVTGQEVTPYVDTTNGNQLVEPFVSVDGTVVNQQDDTNYEANLSDPQQFWLNPYFSFNTTNEVDFARTYATAGGGSEGQQNFQVDTGLEAPGLGCGQDIETLPSGSTQMPQCWLVVVPRGTPAEENASNDSQEFVDTSPLTLEAWNNRIAIPLYFNPVGSSCAIGANEQRIVGSELAQPAVLSWQPALCATPGAPPYSYSTVSDDEARSNITNASYGAAGMSVFTDPINPSETDPSNPVVYAPLTLSGIVIAFSIDRDPALVNGLPDPSEVPLAGTQVQNIFLTPRLVAKLLTESYKDDLQNVTGDRSSSYSWVQNNPATLVDDPDFLQYNPEFSLLTTAQQTAAASLVVEETSSDAATAVWNWILSDPEAAAWLNGKKDPWGMQVNPLYSTNPSANPSGVAFGSPVPENYPQSDPYCWSSGYTTQTTPPVVARPLCILDWSPYALSMNAAGQDVAESNNQAKASFDDDALTPDTAWTSNGPQVTGTSFIISITDSASAAQYGDQVASLSPSGDDGLNRPFVTPDEQSLLAGEAAMTPSSVPGVLSPNPSSTAPNAYPLTMLTYAAATPESLDPTSRQNYATFLQYATGAGQTPGVNVGQLPAGYAPLPAALQTESLAAANAILNPPSTSTATTPTPAPTPTPTTPVTPPTPPPTTPYVATPVATSVTTTTQVPRVLATASLALNANRQPYFGVGAVRWAFLIVLGTGAAATLGTVLFEIRRRRRITSPP
jgi:hypothetical protein